MVEALERSTTGTLSFGSDASYDISTVTSQTLHAELPLSCLAASGAPLTCAEAGLALEIVLAVLPAFDTVSCVNSRQSTCACTFAFGPQSTTEAGTFATRASKVTTTTADGARSASRDFCVQSGSTLHLLEVDVPVDLGPLGSFRIPLGDDVVAARQ